VENVYFHYQVNKLINPGHKKPIKSLCFKPDKENNTLISGGEDKNVMVWNLLEKKLTDCFEGHLEHSGSNYDPNQGHYDTILSIAASTDKIYSTSLDIKIWDYEGKLLKTIPTLKGGHDDIITSIKFSNNNKYVLTSSYDFKLKIWKISKNYLTLLQEIRTGER
jgi:WD40 repeat protein